MSLYGDSQYPVRADLDAIHESQLSKMAAPGTWGNGVQRLAVVAEARRAGIEAGLLEEPADGGAASDVELPDVACRVIGLLATSPKDFQKDDYDQAIADGLSPEEYVELVGLVSRGNDLDVFARGIGVPLRPLPAPQAGEPTRDRPDAAVQEEAWPPTIPNPPDGGQLADKLYGGHPKPYIVRGLSLVPEEMLAHVEMEEVQYLPLKNILEPQYQHHEGFTRSQVEIVAGRVSALNECFY